MKPNASSATALSHCGWRMWFKRCLTVLVDELIWHAILVLVIASGVIAVLLLPGRVFESYWTALAAVVLIFLVLAFAAWIMVRWIARFR